MSYPYPPQQPRKLLRSRQNKVLGGVCGGVAEYVNMDPTLVRVLTVIISLFTGVPVILYLIALFVIPEADPNRTPDYPPVNSGWSYGGTPQDPTQASPNATYGADPVWGAQGAPWEQRQPATPPPPAPEQTSTWESSPADPSPADPSPDKPGDKAV